MKGNVVDLAVGVIIGVAFSAVVTALVEDLITPLIAAIGGEPDFSSLSFTINGSKLTYGEFLNALISFLTVAAVLFFLIVKPLNHLKSRTAEKATPEDPADKKCPECLSEIPRAAKRCRFCTSKV